MLNTNKGYVVFSDHLAGYLLLNSCKLIRVRPDEKDITKSVYIFNNTDNLKTTIEDYNLLKERN